MNSQYQSGFTTLNYALNRVSAAMLISMALMGLTGCGGSGDPTSDVGNQGSDGTTSAGGGQGSDDTGSAENDSRPSFENLLVDENVQYQNEVYRVQFSLSPTKPPTSTGRLTGSVLIYSFSKESTIGYAVSGNYKGCTVTVKLSKETDEGPDVVAPMSINYSGRFISEDLLRLAPKETNLPTLRLLRQGEATRDSECK